MPGSSSRRLSHGSRSVCCKRVVPCFTGTSLLRTPEVHFVNFLPRIRVPTLLLYGRTDLGYPVNTFQAPVFRLLGTPADHERHVILEGGHPPARQQDVIREVLQWLDKYLGPVTPGRPRASSCPPYARGCSGAWSFPRGREVHPPEQGDHSGSRCRALQVGSTRRKTIRTSRSSTPRSSHCRAVAASPSPAWTVAVRYGGT